jgi:RNA polymerase sigma-70 factor (ECF subfamily)
LPNRAPSEVVIAALRCDDRRVEVDRDLVERARRGDREAFAVLVHQVSDSLYAVAYRILRDTGLAEDALQNALVLAWRQLPRLRDLDRFEAWVHRILVHACYDESQRTRSWRTTVTALPLDLPGRADEQAAIADRDELDRAFRRLSVEQRAVFVLHHYVGLPLVEVAEVLGVPAGTARSRLHYAIAGLRDALTSVAEAPAREGRLA